MATVVYTGTGIFAGIIAAALLWWTVSLLGAVLLAPVGASAAMILLALARYLRSADLDVAPDESALVDPAS